MMPIAVAWADSVGEFATLALDAATRPYVLALADGWEAAIAADPELAKGLNAHDGHVVHPAVGAALDLPVRAA